MPDDDSGFDPSDLLIDDSGDGEGVISRVRSVLGIQKEAFACPECGSACEETHTYNPQTAAFDGGACPAWECPDCGRAFVREDEREAHAVDLYGRE
jgi:transposase-like protein